MEKAAKAKANKVRLSPKKTMETCNALKNMKVEEALEYLERVKEEKEAVPYKSRGKQVPHQKNGQSGGFPEKPAKKVQEIIESALKNAEYQGINTENLKVVHASAYKSGSRARPAKKLNSKSMSLTTIEIVLK